MDRPQRSTTTRTTNEKRSLSISDISPTYAFDIGTVEKFSQKIRFLHYAAKKQIWFIFSHLFFVGFINNLKRFFCVCPKQTTKSVNVSSAEQQHNKGVRRRGGRGWWRSGKNRRARAEFIIQLSPFPTDWRGLSCVCGKFALIFLLISPPALSGSVCSPHSIPHPLSLSSTVCLVRPCSCCALFFIFLTEHVPLIASRAKERGIEWGTGTTAAYVLHTHTHTLSLLCSQTS